MKAKDCLGKMDRNGDLALLLDGRPWYDSKGNKVQNVMVQNAIGEVRNETYHVSELHLFNVVPGTDDARAVVSRAQKRIVEYRAYERRVEDWVDRVLEVLTFSGIKAEKSFCHGTVWVYGTGAKKVAKLLKDNGVSGTARPKMRGMDGTVLFPVRVAYKSPVSDD